jgi:hypothetical protein
VHCILLANICIGVDTAAAVEFVSSTYELHALPVALLYVFRIVMLFLNRYF